ncbi:MAG: ribonuclease P protein component [Anaerolineaceae bacterium]|nr:ribonuclease P protein component [Anaerolineaceae bacterium]
MNRLTRSKDFKRVKDFGKSIYHPLLVLVYSRNEGTQTHAAVVAGKTIGNAVIRNKVKRRLKFCLDQLWQNVDWQWDLIFYSRAAIVDANITEIYSAIEHLLLEAGVLGEKNNNNAC